MNEQNEEYHYERNGRGKVITFWISFLFSPFPVAQFP
jgi:hypothetical protein